MLLSRARRALRRGIVRFMDWGEAFTSVTFWTAVTALVAFAGAAGGLIAWAVNAWMERRTRAEADFTADVSAQFDSSRRADNSTIILSGHIANTGDAAAHGVRIEGSGVGVGFIERVDGMIPLPLPFVPVMRPGDSIHFSGTLNDDAVWSKAEVTMTWTPSPTRLKKKATLAISLAELCDDPRKTPRTTGGSALQ